jgi:hypothetical protein
MLYRLVTNHNLRDFVPEVRTSESLSSRTKSLYVVSYVASYQFGQLDFESNTHKILIYLEPMSIISITCLASQAGTRLLVHVFASIPVKDIVVMMWYCISASGCTILYCIGMGGQGLRHFFHVLDIILERTKKLGGSQYLEPRILATSVPSARTSLARGLTSGRRYVTSVVGWLICGGSNLP